MSVHKAANIARADDGAAAEGHGTVSVASGSGGQDAAVVDARSTGGLTANGTGIAGSVAATDTHILKGQILHRTAIEGAEKGYAKIRNLVKVTVKGAGEFSQTTGKTRRINISGQKITGCKVGNLVKTRYRNT